MLKVLHLISKEKKTKHDALSKKFRLSLSFTLFKQSKQMLLQPLNRYKIMNIYIRMFYRRKDVALTLQQYHGSKHCR
jgi:hypothetical protein